MESSPRPLLPCASSLPAGFIEDQGYEEKEWSTAAAVVGCIFPEFGNGEISERPSGSPIFLEDAEDDLLLSEISEVALWHQDYGFTSYEYWQDSPAKKIDSPCIHDLLSCSGDEWSKGSRPSSDFLQDLDWSYPGKCDQLCTDSGGKGSANRRTFSWVDDLWQLDSSQEHGKQRFLDTHGTESVDKFSVNQGENAGFLKINNASKASYYKQIASTLEDLKKVNEEELKELSRINIELRSRWLMLQYEKEVLKSHFARAIDLNDALTLLLKVLPGAQGSNTNIGTEPKSLCRPFEGVQDLTDSGKCMLDLSQVKEIL